MMFQPSSLDDMYPVKAGDSFQSDNLGENGYKPNSGKIKSLFRSLTGEVESSALVMGQFEMKAYSNYITNGMSGSLLNYFSDKEYKEASRVNTVQDQTTGNHPWFDAAGEILPYIAGAFASEGTTALASSASKLASRSGLDSFSSGLGGLFGKDIAEETASKEAKNLFNNVVEPATLSTESQAVHLGMNKALSLAKPLLRPMAESIAYTEPTTVASSLTLDRKGNVHVNTDNLIFGNALAAGLPVFGHVAYKGFRSLRRIRTIGAKPPVKEDVPLGDQEDTQVDISKDTQADTKADTKQSTKTDIPSETDTQVPAIKKQDVQEIYKDTVNTLHKKGGETSDLHLPDIGEAETSAEYGLQNISNINYLHVASSRIQKLVDNDPEINGNKVAFDSEEFRAHVNSTHDVLEQAKNNRGRIKVSLSKGLDGYNGKFKSILKKAKEMPYMSDGNLKNENGDFFYQFSDRKYNSEDTSELQTAAKNGDNDAMKILALKNLSATDHIDYSLAKTKMLRQFIRLHKGGILKYAENWGKDDDSMLNEFVSNMFKQNAEYFSDPLSKGYVLLSKNDRAFKDLVECLIKFGE